MAEVQLQFQENIVQNKSLYINDLYNKYAAMLLGYIFEAVKNMELAEQYLIAVFKDIPHEIEEIPGVNTFCYLQQMARKKLNKFFESANTDAVVSHNNKLIAQMSPEQQLVFCGVYWQGKSINRLAAELDKSEDSVKKILNECFTTIRRNSSK